MLRIKKNVKTVIVNNSVMVRGGGREKGTGGVCARQQFSEYVSIGRACARVCVYEKFTKRGLWGIRASAAKLR